MENKSKINHNGKPWSVNFLCDDDNCEYKENEIYMPGEAIPYMFTDHFCPMCGGILKRSEIGKDNEQRERWRD